LNVILYSRKHFTVEMSISGTLNVGLYPSLTQFCIVAVSEYCVSTYKMTRYDNIGISKAIYFPGMA